MCTPISADMNLPQTAKTGISIDSQFSPTLKNPIRFTMLVQWAGHPKIWGIWTPSNTRLLEPKAHPSLHPVSVSIASASLTVRTKPTDYATTRQSRAIGRLRSSFTQQLLVPPYRLVCQQSAVARFLLQPPPSGTLYPTTFNLHHLFLPFAGS